MLTILSDWSILAPFLVAALALNLTPGADMTYTIARTAAQGRMAGYASSLGIAAGSAVHTLAAAAGLSALLLASQTAFEVVKYAGAAYLLYLAARMLLTRPEPGSLSLPHAGLWRVFGQGALVNVLNPKVGLFMLAFLPQFVDPAAGSPALQILVLGSIFNLGGLAVNMSVATLIGVSMARVKNSARFARVMNSISGAVLAILALRLAVAER